MEIIKDERLKHRLVGLGVIISLAAIFLPAVLKQSQERIGDNLRVSVKLPHKPALPQVNIPASKIMFETIKVAHVDIASVNQSIPRYTTLARTKPAQAPQHAVTVAVKKPVPASVLKSMPPPVSQVEKVALPAAVVKATAAPAPMVRNAPVRLPIKKPQMQVQRKQYGVQVATFSKPENAASLVTKLKDKGFLARSSPISTAKGTLYKVLVGSTIQRVQALRLQEQLAASMQLKGFVVSTEVS